MEGMKKYISTTVKVLWIILLGIIYGCTKINTIPHPQISEQLARSEKVTFAEKPGIIMRNGKQFIRFKCTSACDATVSIVNSDGKILRHIGSAVIGGNTPPPFQKNSLLQEIEWDGKDERGQDIPHGSRVVVALNTIPCFSGFINIEQPSIIGRGVVGMGVDNKSTLYVMQGRAWQHVVANPEIVAFSSNGKYLRTIVPPQVDIETDRQKISPSYISYMRRQIFILHDDQIIMISGIGTPDREGKGTARRLIRLRVDGTLPADHLGPCLPEGLRWSAEVGPSALYLAMSPDGKTFYLSGLWSGKSPKALTHQIYKAKWNTPVFEKFLGGDVGVAASADGSFNNPRGLAVDTKGHLYICDYMNDRIQVFTSEGTFIKKLSVPGPEQIAVHPRTGEIYVLSVRDKGVTATYTAGVVWEVLKQKSVVKFRSVDDFSEVTRIELPQRELYLHDTGPVMVLDGNSQPPVLWISCVGRQEADDYLWKILDKGEKLEKVTTPIPRYYSPFGPSGGIMVIDRQTDELYIGGRSMPNILRVNGTTGKIENLENLTTILYNGDKRPFKPRQITGMAVDNNSCIYFRLMGTWSGIENWLYRFNRDETPAPFPVTSKELTISQPSHGYHLSTVDVHPSGDIYLINLAPGSKHRNTNEYNVVSIYSKDGSLKEISHVKFLTSGAWGPKFDRRGGMYLTEAVRPIGEKNETVGSLIRFHSHHAELIAHEPDSAKNFLYEMRLREHAIVPVEIRGADWIYYGASPVPFGHCVCPSSHFDIDEYDRIALMDANKHRIKLLDSAGNLVITLGEYANRDASGSGSNMPVHSIPVCGIATLAIGNNRVYIWDKPANRIVVVKLDYSVQESAPVDIQQ